MGLFSSARRNRAGSQGQGGDVLISGNSEKAFAHDFYIGYKIYHHAKPFSHLLGHLSDLSFLPAEPADILLQPALSSYPCYALNAPFQVHKDSMRFLKCKDGGGYYVEFAFDSTTRCTIHVLFCAKEVYCLSIPKYQPEKDMPSFSYNYLPGMDQVFSHSESSVNLDAIALKRFTHELGSDVFPLVVLLENQDPVRCCHITLAAVERQSNRSYAVRVLKQKLVIDKACFLLLEIYGVDKTLGMDTSSLELSTDCVVCLSACRDTLLLPCRHFCTCSTCADSLRMQTKLCPICRAEFHSVMKVEFQSNVPTDETVMSELSSNISQLVHKVHDHSKHSTVWRVSWSTRFMITPSTARSVE